MLIYNIRLVDYVSYIHSPPLPRTVLSVKQSQLARLFKTVIDFERKLCRCALSGGTNTVHRSFLNIYMLDLLLVKNTVRSKPSRELARFASLAGNALRFMPTFREFKITMTGAGELSCLFASWMAHWLI